MCLGLRVRGFRGEEALGSRAVFEFSDFTESLNSGRFGVLKFSKKQSLARFLGVLVARYQAFGLPKRSCE